MLGVTGGGAEDLDRAGEILRGVPRQKYNRTVYMVDSNEKGVIQLHPEPRALIEKVNRVDANRTGLGFPGRPKCWPSNKATATSHEVDREGHEHPFDFRHATCPALIRLVFDRGAGRIRRSSAAISGRLCSATWWWVFWSPSSLSWWWCLR